MDKKINVTIFNEFFHEKTRESVKKIYPDGIHGALSEKLSAFGEYNLTVVTQDMEEHGLTEEVLANTDVARYIHGLTNGRASSTPYPTDSIFPTMFRVIRENMPDAQLASFCNWNSINIGIIEDGLGVTKGSGGDENLTE